MLPAKPMPVLDGSSVCKVAILTHDKSLSFSSCAGHAAWLVDDHCAKKPSPTDCLDSPNAIIHMVEGQNYVLGIMVFWYPDRRWWHALLPYNVHIRMAALKEALQEVSRDCKELEGRWFKDLGRCVMDEFAERQLYVRAALLVPTDALRLKAPEGFIYNHLMGSTPFGNRRRLTLLLLPDIS